MKTSYLCAECLLRQACEACDHALTIGKNGMKQSSGLLISSKTPFMRLSGIVSK